MDAPTSILIVEDDDATRAFLADNLSADGFKVATASGAGEGLRALEVRQPDLVVLDLLLEDGSGLALLDRVRSADGLASRLDPDLPVLVLTGRSGDSDRVRSLARGADDHLCKPFVYAELLARIRALLRRASGRRQRGVLRVGELTLDPATRAVRLAGRPVELSAKEFALLQALAEQPTRVLAKNDLLRDVWGYVSIGNNRRISYVAAVGSKRLRLDGLVRVSQANGRGGDDFRSPAQQREVCERWAAANGAEVVCWHESVDVSGKTMRRDDVDAALERVHASQTDGVVVAWLDRFSRAKVGDALKVYEDFGAAGGRVVAADMAGLNADDATGEMALTTLLAVGRMQWRRSQERWDMNRGDAVRDGKVPGGAPFGYRYRDATKRGRGVVDSRLVPDGKLAPLVRELFERKAAGATWLELARWLDAVAPKPNRGHWARGSVRTMIECRTYLGEARHGRHVNVDAHEPLVSSALRRRAQGRPGRRTPRGTYLLSGLVRCAGCGRRMRGTSLGRGGKRIYTCDGADCPARSTVTVDLLDGEVVEQFFAHLDDFHVRAVDDAELAAARVEVEQRTREVETLAMVAPTHPTAVAAHQQALGAAERLLLGAEDRLHDLTSSLTELPDVRELRADWPNLTLDERREILRAGVDAVLVRRVASRARPPVRERIRVLFRGEAPAGLRDNGRAGSVTTWAWNGDPGSLVASP